MENKEQKNDMPKYEERLLQWMFYFVTFIWINIRDKDAAPLAQLISWLVFTAIWFWILYWIWYLIKIILKIWKH